jgi:hypothetical protein
VAKLLSRPIRDLFRSPIRRPGPGTPVEGGGVVPPPGYVFLVDDDGYYLIDSDGYYLIEAI